MVFEYRDSDGARLRVDNVNASTYYGNEAVVALLTEHPHDDDMPVVYIPLDRVEEVIAGIRDAARTASGQQPETTVAYGDGKGRVYCQRCAPTVEAASVPLTVDHVDHWELCPSCGRHVVDVAREAPAVGQPAEAQAADEARPPATSWTACRRGDTDWLVASSNYDDRDQALERLAKRRKEQPDAKFALVRETTTWTVEDETR